MRRMGIARRAPSSRKDGRSTGYAGRGSIPGQYWLAMLGKPDNGFWSVTAEQARRRESPRRYLDHSPLLETQVQTPARCKSHRFMPFTDARAEATCCLVSTSRFTRAKWR